MSGKEAQPVCRSCGKPVASDEIHLCEVCTKAQGWHVELLPQVRELILSKGEFAPFEPDKEFLEQVEQRCQKSVADRGFPVEPGKLYVTRNGYEMFKKHWSDILKERGWTESAVRFVDDILRRDVV
jgi:hypothetical protein